MHSMTGTKQRLRCLAVSSTCGLADDLVVFIVGANPDPQDAIFDVGA